MAEFKYSPIYQLTDDATEYRLLSSDFIKIEKFKGRDILSLDPEALTLMSYEAFKDISFFLRPSHLRKMQHIFKDQDASENDRFVATTLLQNAVVSSAMVLPT